MLNMGSHLASTDVLGHIKDLMHLFERMSGLQQMGLGPDPMDDKEIKEEEHALHVDSVTFLRKLAKDLGVKIRFEK